MIDEPLEFYVSGLVQGHLLTVIGRCGGQPIHVGDTFDTLYRYLRRHFPEEIGADPVRELERPVKLRVVCIHACDRSLPSLGRGMTGSLTIEGEGFDQIGPGWVLGRFGAGPAQSTLSTASALS
jgi:hypothetical protein